MIIVEDAFAKIKNYYFILSIIFGTSTEKMFKWKSQKI